VDSRAAEAIENSRPRLARGAPVLAGARNRLLITGNVKHPTVLRLMGANVSKYEIFVFNSGKIDCTALKYTLHFTQNTYYQAHTSLPNTHTLKLGN